LPALVFVLTFIGLLLSGSLFVPLNPAVMHPDILQAACRNEQPAPDGRHRQGLYSEERR